LGDWQLPDARRLVLVDVLLAFVDGEAHERVAAVKEEPAFVVEVARLVEGFPERVGGPAGRLPASQLIDAVLPDSSSQMFGRSTSSPYPSPDSPKSCTPTGGAPLGSHEAHVMLPPPLR